MKILGDPRSTHKPAAERPLSPHTVNQPSKPRSGYQSWRDVARTCEVKSCARAFYATRHDARFCSTKCKQLAYRARVRRAVTEKLELARNATSATSTSRYGTAPASKRNAKKRGRS